MSVSTITAEQLHAIVQTGQPVDLMDVRTPAEFREVHVAVARNVPLDRLDALQIAAQRNGSQQTLYVICRSGGRGKQACEKILAQGYAQVVNVAGGTQAWEQAGFPVVRGQKCVSLERQGRIAAGTLVVTGAVLGALVHPYWIALSGAIGGGLIFSGITDTCGMGLLLARMPWNRRGEAQSCATRPVAGH